MSEMNEHSTKSDAPAAGADPTKVYSTFQLLTAMCIMLGVTVEELEVYQRDLAERRTTPREELEIPLVLLSRYQTERAL